MEIVIREYKNTDFYALFCLLEENYNSRINQETLERIYLSHNRSILIAETHDNHLVGCAFWEIQRDYVRTLNILYITYVAVEKDFRNLGIGRRLFEAIEHKCKEYGCTAIELTSADYRTDAHAFYRALGFEKKKTTVFIKEI